MRGGANSKTDGRAWAARSVSLGMLAVLATTVGGSAFAQDASAPSAIPQGSIATNLPENGDPGGRRKALADRGFTYVLYYTNDVLANVQGGLKRGTIDQGKLEGALTIDLEKAGG